MAKKNKTIRNIIIGVAVLAVLSGVYFLVMKWEPEQQTEEQPQPTAQAVQVFKADVGEVAKVDVNGDNGALHYYKKPETKTTKDADGNETRTEVDVWYLSGYENANLTATKIENAVSSFCDMQAEKEVTTDMSKKADYGLETPRATAAVTLADGTTYTLLLGGTVPTSDNYYAMLEGGNAIYAISSYKANLMLAKPLAFKNTSIASITEEKFQTFSLTANGQKVMDVRKQQEGETLLNSNMTDYVMTYPYYEAVKADEFAEILNAVSSIMADEFVAVAPSDLSVYGLNSPRYEISLADESYSYHIKIGADVPKENEDDKQLVYVMAEGEPCVFTMSADMLNTLKNIDAFALTEKFVHLVDVSGVQSVVVQSEDKTYTLEVEHIKETNDVGDEVDDQNYKINGKDANQKRSKAAYQSIIGHLASSADAKNAGQVRCTITFHMADGTQSTIQYADCDERNYTAIKDGQASGLKVLKKSIRDMLQTLEELDADPTAAA